MVGLTTDVSGDCIGTAEVVAALSLATDLAIGVPFEHGLQSAIVAARLGKHLGVDDEAARLTLYASLLFYIGCTAGSELASEVFGADDALTVHGTPVRFGSRPEMVRGMLRAVAPPGGPIARRAGQLTNLPRLVRGMGDHAAASCEVARMLSARLGLPSSIGELFSFTDERWDGKGIPGRTGGEGIPLPMRIVQVARDATFQCALDGPERAASVISERASHAFDPNVARTFVHHARDILPVEEAGSLWDVALACEPEPRLVLNGHAIDRALTAVGDFADLASRYLAGHTAMVARLAETGGEAIGLDAATVCMLRRAALVHDVGRVAVPVRIWNHPAPLQRG